MMLTSLALLLTACSSPADETGFDGEEGWVPHCEESRAVITADEVTALGFSAQQVLDFAAVEHTTTLTHAGGDAAPMTLNVRYIDGDIEFVTSTEAAPPDDVTSIAAIAVICDDYITLPVSVDAASDDGALDVTWSVTLSAFDAQRADFWIEEPVSDYEDRFDLSGVDRGELDSESIAVSGAFGAARGATGEIAHVGEGSDGQAAWQSMVQLASWGEGE